MPKTTKNAVDDAATGTAGRFCYRYRVQYSVRQFVEMAAAQLGIKCALKARALKRRALWFPSPGIRAGR